MATGKGDIRVVITGDASAFNRAMGQVEGTARKSAQTVGRDFSTLGRTMGAALATVASAQALRGLVSIADTYTNLESRLKLVTSSSQELAAVQQQLYNVANDTRTSYEGTLDLYTRFAQATRDTAISQTDLLAVVKGTNQALIVSGGSAASADAAMVQFSQALASGVLRGEEFNSMSEQAPAILRMVADGLGVTTGQLRAMAKEGQLTNDVVIPALLSQLGKMDQQFGQMGTTVQQAGVVLANVLQSLVADANKGSGASAELAASILDVARMVEANRDLILSLFSGVVEAAGWAAERVFNLANSVKGFAAVAAGALSIKDYFSMTGEEFREWDKNFGTALGNMQDRVKQTAAALKALREEDPDLVDEDALGRAERAYNAATKELAAFSAAGKQVATSQKQVTPAVTATGKAVDVAAGAKKTLAKESGTAAKAAKDLAAEQKRLADEAERTGRAQIEAATKTREMTAELDRALFGTADAYETLGLTSRKSYEDQVKAATEAYERILSIEDLTDSERARLREGLQSRLIELEEDYRGKAEETIGAIAIAWEDLTEDTKQVLHDWVEDAIKMEFDSVGDAFEGLAESILNVWIDLLAKMIAEWAISGIASLFSGGNLLGGISSGLGGLLGDIPVVGGLFKSGDKVMDWGLNALGGSALAAGGASLLGGGGGAGIGAALGGGVSAGAAALFPSVFDAGAAATSFGAGAAEAFGSALIGGPTAGGLEWAAIPGKEFFGTGASQTAAAGGAGIGTAAAFGGMAAFAGGLYALASMTATPWQSITSPTLGIGVDMPIHGGYGESDARRRASTLLDIESGLYDPTAGGGGDTIGMGSLAEFDLKPIIEDARGLLDILANQWGDGLASLALQLDGTVASTDALLDAATGYDVALQSSAEIHDLAAAAVGGNERAMDALRAALMSLGLSEQQTETAMLGLIAATGTQATTLTSAASAATTAAGAMSGMAGVISSADSAANSATGAMSGMAGVISSADSAANSAAGAISGMVGDIRTLSRTPLNIRVGVETYRIENHNPYAVHASGGIFASPTLIPSVRGTRHLVGEAGAEAIMPLHAGPKTLEMMDRKLDALAARPVTMTINLDGQQIARATMPMVDAHVAAKASRGMLATQTRFRG